MNDFQVYGSAITYFRRYALSSILGIVTDKDIDAHGKQETTLSDDRFAKALVSVSNGVYKKETLISNYDLTEDQLKQLNKI